MTIKRFVLSALLLATLQACGIGSPKLDGRNQSVLNQANQMITSGNPAAGARMLFEAANQSSGKQREDLFLRAASAYLDASDTQAATTALAQVSGSNQRLATLKQIETARLYVIQGDYQRALSQLPNTTSKDPNIRMRQIVTQSAAYEGMGDYAKALSLRLSLSDSRGLDPTLALQNQSAIWRIISSLDSGQRSSISQQINHVDLPGWLLLANADASPDRSQAISTWRQRFSFHPAVQSGFVDQLLGGQSQGPITANVDGMGMGSIAVLLPLSGGAQAFSQQVVQGAQSFAKAQGVESGLTLIDTASGIENAVAQASASGAQSIVGPLTKANVSALMNMPGRNIPAIALNDLGVATIDGSVIQFGLTPENEAEDAAAYALSKGHRQAYILVPKNSSGQRLSDAFESAFTGGGGRIAGKASFSPKARDFTGTIRGISAALNEADMIFMPARRQAARLLGAQLKFFKVNRPLYATSRFNESPFDPRLDGDIAGLMFNEAPAVLSDRYGNIAKESARLRAFGADAVRLAQAAPSLINNPQQSLDGESGALHIDAGLRVRRVLDWARIGSSGIERIDYGNRR